MGFKDKKGITVASGFKLQAAALLDARGQVKTLSLIHISEPTRP